MSDVPPTLQSLLRKEGQPTTQEEVPRPRSRTFTRVVLPLSILFGAGSVLAYSARDSLLPAPQVDVTPVVTKSTSSPHGTDCDDTGNKLWTGSGGEGIIAQAPGWVEPAPFPIAVQALTPGVVERVHVLEGDRVERGQRVATLIAEDARLALTRERSEMAELRASKARSRALLVTARARASELEEELDRKRHIKDVGGATIAEIQVLEHRLRALGGEIDAARAGMAGAEAALERQRVVVAEAALMLERTVIRAPIDGVVMTRSIVPGTRLTISPDEQMERHMMGVISLYDPAQLQARADVALPDAGKVALGTRAKMTTEAAPGVVFEGEVTRLLHRADIQRNTLQVKVTIENPNGLLKPDMLMRVRFVETSEGALPHEAHGLHDPLSILAAKGALMNRARERADVWVIEPGARGRLPTVRKQEVVLGAEYGEMVFVCSGVSPGDRLVLEPPNKLVDGRRVRARSTIQETASLERGN